MHGLRAVDAKSTLHRPNMPWRLEPGRLPSLPARGHGLPAHTLHRTLARNSGHNLHSARGLPGTCMQQPNRSARLVHRA